MNTIKAEGKQSHFRIDISRNISLTDAFLQVCPQLISATELCLGRSLGTTGQYASTWKLDGLSPTHGAGFPLP